MEIDQLKLTIEAILLASGEPLTLDRIGQCFLEQERPEKSQLKEALSVLIEDYQQRGIELKQIASGYCFQARQEYSEWIARLWEEKPPRYSRALLETLVIIAYRQPVTRADIEDVRGVAVSTHIIKTLLEREWIKIIGHRDVPGKPAILGTTKQFLDYFNLASLEDLPPLAEVKDIDQLIQSVDEKVQARVTDVIEQPQQQELTLEEQQQEQELAIEEPA